MLQETKHFVWGVVSQLWLLIFVWKIFLQVKHLMRLVKRLEDENQVKDKKIRLAEKDQENLNALNVALQEKNFRLKKRIEECEDDVTG